MDDPAASDAPAASDPSWARPGSEPTGAPPSPPPPAAKGGSAGLVAVLAAMFVVLLGVVGGLGYYLLRDDDDGSSYPLALDDDEYDLEAMVLRNKDLPEGMVLVQRNGFDNPDWAELTGPDDPEGKLAQLEAQERVRSHVSFFSWPDGPIQHLGRVLSITSQSTLYASEDAAQESLEGRALCGLLLDPNGDSRDFRVPDLGDGAVGFFVTEVDDDLGKSVDTVICFRTGRIVHGLIQSGLDGTEDIAQAVRLARKMFVRVENAYDGVEDPLDELDEDG
ncbi:MAG: hypothetical protein ACKVVT_18740 [Dehalococcoidia bacterium]